MTSPLLETRRLTAGYGDAAVIRDIDLRVFPGEVVALLGPNGAGKTTTLLALCGELRPMDGQILIDGAGTHRPLHVRARQGLSLVTEQRSVFVKMTVAENLRVSRCDTARALEMFPELEPHLRRRVGLLSGGQQQMLALARALTRGRPRLVLIDEVSLGLAPQIVDRLLRVIRDAAESGVGIILVEQYVHKALKVADRLYVLRQGRIVESGATSEFRGKVAALQQAYLSA